MAAFQRDAVIPTILFRASSHCQCKLVTIAGHLSCLSATDLYRYLSQEHDATTVGVLLGMAASKRGTLDPVISKMLFLHVPARHPATYPELELSPLVQASALLGVGLLYQGSCHRFAPSPSLTPPPNTVS